MTYDDHRGMAQSIENILDAIIWNVFSAGKELKEKGGWFIN